MGMDYYIMPNKEVNCDNEFPERLSFFFEQVGGYGEYAEVSQVSRILGINLSIFQDVEYDVNDEDEENLHWHSVEEYLVVIAEFLTKLGERPTYYEQVGHQACPDAGEFKHELQRIIALPDPTQQDREWKTLEAQYARLCPPDYGYLSSSQLVDDLKILQQTLHCYKSNGVTEAKLFYM